MITTYRRIRKTVVILLFLFALSNFPLVCGTQSAVGFGNTREEATRNAYQNLAYQLQMRVDASNRLLIYDQNKNKEQVFISGNSVFANTKELIGVTYESIRLPDGDYKVTATIDETLASRYKETLSNLKNEIEKTERRLQQDKESYTKQALVLLLTNYNWFESYSNVARSLDNNIIIPDLSTSKAKTELAYKELLDNELGNLARKLENLRAQNASSELIRDLTRNIEECENEIKAWNDSQQLNQTQLKKHLDSKAVLQATAQREIEKIISQRESRKKPIDVIEDIERQKHTYREIEQTLQEKIREQEILIMSIYEKELQNLINTPYRKAELLSTGIPTDIAKQNRDRLIKHNQEEQEKELQKSKQQLENSVNRELRSIENSIQRQLKQLESMKETLSSLKGEVKILIGKYNGNKAGWPIELQFILFDKQYLYTDIFVPYEKMTDEKVPSLQPGNSKEVQAYEKYLDTVDLLDTYFASFSNALYSTVEYSTQAGESLSEYIVLLHSIKLIRSDTKAIVHEVPISHPYEKKHIIQSSIDVEIPIKYKSPYKKFLERLDSLEKPYGNQGFKAGGFEVGSNTFVTNLIVGKNWLGLNLTRSIPINNYLKYLDTKNAFSLGFSGGYFISDFNLKNTTGYEGDGQSYDTSASINQGFEFLGFVNYSPFSVCTEFVDHACTLKLDAGLIASKKRLNFSSHLSILYRWQTRKNSLLYELGLRFNLTGLSPGSVTLVFGVTAGYLTALITSPWQIKSLYSIEPYQLSGTKPGK